jgi:hypothetical protein
VRNLEIVIFFPQVRKSKGHTVLFLGEEPKNRRFTPLGEKPKTMNLKVLSKEN